MNRHRSSLIALVFSTTGLLLSPSAEAVTYKFKRWTLNDTRGNNELVEIGGRRYVGRGGKVRKVSDEEGKQLVREFAQKIGPLRSGGHSWGNGFLERRSVGEFGKRTEGFVDSHIVTKRGWDGVTLDRGVLKAALKLRAGGKQPR